MFLLYRVAFAPLGWDFVLALVLLNKACFLFPALSASRVFLQVGPHLFAEKSQLHLLARQEMPKGTTVYVSISIRMRQNLCSFISDVLTGGIAVSIHQRQHWSVNERGSNQSGLD